MTTAAPESRTPSDGTKDRSVKSALNILQTLFADAPRRQLEPEFFEELATELRGLHAQIRIHHTVGHIATDEKTPSSPEFQDEFNRLAEEHSTMLHWTPQGFESDVLGPPPKDFHDKGDD